MNANSMKVTELCVKDERTKEEDRSHAHQCLPVQLEKTHNAKLYLSNTWAVMEWMLQVLGFQDRRANERITKGEISVSLEVGRTEYERSLGSQMSSVSRGIPSHLQKNDCINAVRRQEATSLLEALAGVSCMALSSKLTFRGFAYGGRCSAPEVSIQYIWLMMVTGQILQGHLVEYVSPFFYLKNTTESLAYYVTL